MYIIKLSDGFYYRGLGSRSKITDKKTEAKEYSSFEDAKMVASSTGVEKYEIINTQV